MADPTTSVIATNTIGFLAGGTGVVILGVNTGLDYPTLIAGVAGGATALTYLQRSSWWKRALEVASASLLAGYASPFVASILNVILLKILPEGLDLPQGPTQVCTAFIIAYLAHGVLLPALRKIVAARAARYSQ